ncbi:hypothetical protein SAMN04488045_3654 [Thalassococcus halodurans]|jgi:hypothetical protein|uniref:Hydrogenase expression/formation protein HupK n=1 Tax=Thalassococcus halodurans TaxID=373675 RepID=A0A1H6BN73_9RHOB|nr:hydrogenase expression/formation protein HupK [Thalassococcus halodurans]SEG62169.1 hypothetical protein SAMN04488045_3654 [Thalassococcus halodurans]
MLDRTQSPLTVEPVATPPVAAMVLGRPVQDAADLLPRLFNLCRASQDVAVRMAFDLPLADGWEAALSQDIARDHLLKLGVILPQRLGLAPCVVPSPDLAEMAASLVGDDPFPKTGDGFETFLTSASPLAEMMQAVDACFAPKEASVQGLALPEAATPDATAALENSVAARHLSHPVMLHVAETRGQGPLWRIVARVLDMLAALEGNLPIPVKQDDWVMVPAARGSYFVQGSSRDGLVTSFTRITPTDHMLAKGGIMEQSLARLPEDKQRMAPLLVDILDPCVQVTITGGKQDA